MIASPSQTYILVKMQDFIPGCPQVHSHIHPLIYRTSQVWAFLEVLTAYKLARLASLYAGKISAHLP